MPSSDTPTAAARSERRLRWIALASLVPLIPMTMAATGWRDLREIRRNQELRAIDIPPGGVAEYAGARVALVGMNAIPYEPGLPKDRTFLRARLSIAPAQANTAWGACRLNVTDGAGHAWAPINPVPSLVTTMLARPGEEAGTTCDGLSVPQAKPGTTLFVDSYYLVPRPIPDLRVRMSTMEGRPAYVRFAAGKVQ